VENNDERPLTDQWLFEPRPLKLLVRTLLLVPVILAAVLYPFMEGYSVNFLFLCLLSPFFFALYSRVGKKVEKLRASLAEEVVEAVPGMIVNGPIQAPGLAAVTEKELVLTPIVGDPIRLPFTDIESSKEVRWFNGSMLWYKKGFWFTVPGRKRLGLAVPAVFADRLRERLGKQ